MHPGLPAGARRRVSETPEQAWQRPVSWANVASDPIGAVTCRYRGDTHAEVWIPITAQAA